MHGSRSLSRQETQNMAKGYEAPPGVDIASLRKQHKSTAMDLMRPGNGTPWEDRGALGTPKAFLTTCVKSITNPAMLLDHIRRPDTTNEASQFAYGCSAFWGISAAIHLLILHKLYRPAWADALEREIGTVYDTQYYIKTAILSVVIALAAYVLLVVFAKRLYFALVASELKNNAPPVLVHNVFCYCMGPSILALVPVAGPPLALALIFWSWCVGGTKRLYVSWRGAIVAAVLTALGVLVMAGVGYFVLGMMLDNMLGLKEPPAQENPDGTRGAVGSAPVR
jgi:membrane protease YdiL (CAAX protease family)